MCDKCFYKIILYKRFTWFYLGKFNLTENKEKTVIECSHYKQIDIVYQMCCEKLIKCINNVNKELLCNKNRT